MPSRSPKVLFAGESWNTYAVHTKGANSYRHSRRLAAAASCRLCAGPQAAEQAPLARLIRGAGWRVAYGRRLYVLLGFRGARSNALTPLAATLPVEISSYDDRIEEPEGITPVVVHDHPVLKGVPRAWPYFLGYNRFKAKAGTQLILSVGEDPFLVVGQHGAGRVAAFASDCSPHWGSPEFLAWPYYSAF
jgi:uncharacterized membrane protein